MQINKSSEFYNMDELTDERLRLLNIAIETKIRDGEGNEKTTFLHNRCQREIYIRSRHAAYSEHF